MIGLWTARRDIYGSSRKLAPRSRDDVVLTVGQTRYWPVVSICTLQQLNAAGHVLYLGARLDGNLSLIQEAIEAASLQYLQAISQQLAM